LARTHPTKMCSALSTWPHILHYILQGLPSSFFSIAQLIEFCHCKPATRRSWFSAES
jgi:hypothetical protein